MSKYVFFVYFLCLVILRESLGQNNVNEKMDVFRLPAVARPESYSLQFTPTFNGLNSTFSGVTRIIVIPTRRTENLTLNAKELELTNVTIYDVGTANPRPIDIISVENVTKNEQVIFHFRRPLIINRRHLVTITYNGKIRTDMSGLYISSYEEGGVTK